ncbi:MAG: hypothetical protein GX856_04425 [Gammaproteobacteria bacterium]|jgi:hypothetical protein|nr:hypothetical protein [Gammaproteobacteria bacterium]
MAIKKNIDRAYFKVIRVDLTHRNMGADNAVTARVPPGALVTGVTCFGALAVNSGTTATATIADGTNTFVNAQSVATTGVKTVALSQAYYPNGGTITFSLAETGTAATAGHVIATVSYVHMGASEAGIQE